MEILLSIILFLTILSILVLVHEAGHFFAARLFSIHVEEFGLGFPPRIKGWKRGPTVYSVNWLPFGGFVKLKGEHGEAAGERDSFISQAIWKRVVILVAGVFMNVLLAVILLTIGFSAGMPQVIDTDDEISASVRKAQIQIINVMQDSPAQQAGIQLGDIVRTVDKQSFEKISDLQHYIKTHAGQMILVSLQRGSNILQKEIIPKSFRKEEPAMIGVALAKTAVIAYPLDRAFILAVKTTAMLAIGIISMLGVAISRFAFDGFVGPVGIAAYTTTAAQLGFSYLINLMAQLSVSLAVLNVLPIPALDGGRVLFALVEKVRGRSLRPVLENAIHLIGFFMLLLLLLAVTLRDIGRLIPS